MIELTRTWYRFGRTDKLETLEVHKETEKRLYYRSPRWVERWVSKNGGVYDMIPWHDSKDAAIEWKRVYLKDKVYTAQKVLDDCVKRHNDFVREHGL